MQSVRAFLAKPLVRQAVQNLGWLVVERAGKFVLGALVGLFVARYLGPERLGSLSFAVALVSLLSCLPSLGLDAVLKRELLTSPERAPELLASGWWLRLGAGAVAFLVIWVFAGAGWGLTAEELRLLRILGLTLFQPALYLPELWLQAHLRAKRTTLVQLGALAVSSGARIWLVFTGAGLAAFAWVIVVEMFLCALGYLFVAGGPGRSYLRSSAPHQLMGRLLAEAWPLMFANFAVVVYLRIDEVMLRQLAGPSAVGIYAAAVKLSELWYFLPLALGTSVLPALLRARERGDGSYAERQQQYYDLSAGLAYLLSVPTALLAPWVIRVAYGAEFAAAGPILAVHIWASVFVFLGVARGQWLVNEGLQKFYLAATVLGAVANVLLNFIFIPRWGGSGAAWATVISYALAGWLASYFHPAARPTAAAQTRALLIPFRCGRYLRKL